MIELHSDLDISLTSFLILNMKIYGKIWPNLGLWGAPVSK